ncbi:envelope biogenesis lipoprotein LpqN [Mycobacterium sp. URHB0021]
MNPPLRTPGPPQYRGVNLWLTVIAVGVLVLGACSQSESSGSEPSGQDVGVAAPVQRTISGTSDDWLSAVCEPGRLYENPSMPGAVGGATCAPRVTTPNPNTQIWISQFDSEFTMRNVLPARLAKYAATTEHSGLIWTFSIIDSDPSPLRPLEQFGFSIEQVAARGTAPPISRAPPTTAPAPPNRSALPAPTRERSAGRQPTIASYIKENGIAETPAKRGDPVSPTINLPFPPGWEDAGSRTPDWAYSAILSTDPAMAADPPSIIALLSKLTGNVDPWQILMYAPNELRNLPGYDGAQHATSSTLSGFDAVQIGGTYIRDGVKRVIAQKTVVIPTANGLYVFQLNADGTGDQKRALMDATQVIDDKTKITP